MNKYSIGQKHICSINAGWIQIGEPFFILSLNEIKHTALLYAPAIHNHITVTDIFLQKATI